jgi:putative flavoprotein involved in K+ transport
MVTSGMGDSATEDIDAGAVAAVWLCALEEALSLGQAFAVTELFEPDGYWRDQLSFTWNLRTLHGSEAIRDMLEERLVVVGPGEFRLDGPEPVIQPLGEDRQCVQAVFRFSTAYGGGRGVVRLVQAGEDDARWRAWTLLTALHELRGHEERIGSRRPVGLAEGTETFVPWREERQLQCEFADTDPTVVIVGAGQAGLAIGARLGALGVSALIVDTNERVGDNWRGRYRNLVLHDPVWYDHFPYLPFPPNWPVFAPKDKMGDWLESYANVMEINVWTGTRFDGGFYDTEAGRWEVTVTRSGGVRRSLRPRHVVLATGVSGSPRIPDLPGIDGFGGETVHSSRFTDGVRWANRRAVVVGAGNSGHDIALELHQSGADVTMVQRSSTYVVSRDNGQAIFAGLYEENGPSTEDADLLNASLPLDVVRAMFVQVTAALAEQDKELLDGLRARGFLVGFGEDGSGLMFNLLSRLGGYTIDTGASSLIAEGQVKLASGAGPRQFTRDGVELDDGRHLGADLVVFATGYHDMRETARALLGDEVAERCGPVWGLDDEGELRTVFRRSGQEGLWFTGGNLQSSRYNSRLLALQIKAIEENLLPRQVGERGRQG